MPPDLFAGGFRCEIYTPIFHYLRTTLFAAHISIEITAATRKRSSQNGRRARFDPRVSSQSNAPRSNYSSGQGSRPFQTLIATIIIFDEISRMGRRAYTPVRIAGTKLVCLLERVRRPGRAIYETEIAENRQTVRDRRCVPPLEFALQRLQYSRLRSSRRS